jgi:hypothetical protein
METHAPLGPDDFLVLEKNTGRVRRVQGGVVQSTPVLDVAVNPGGERGLLGIAINDESPPGVFLYYTEALDLSGTGADGGALLGNRIYRYTWNAGSGVLESPRRSSSTCRRPRRGRTRAACWPSVRRRPRAPDRSATVASSTARYVVRIASGSVARIALAPPATPTPMRTPTPTATPLACAPAPEPCRTPAIGGRAYVRLQHDPEGRRSKLTWKWLGGAATATAELGTPETTDDYVLCLYDGGGLLATLHAPAGGQCGLASCWRRGAHTIQYRNRDLLPDGLRSLAFREGADGRAQTVAQGKGSALPIPSRGGVTSPLTVELKRATGPCFAARYAFPPALTVTPSVFRDRAD